jgi:hypothetical protein
MHHPYYEGVPLTGRAIRCNALFVTSQNISAAIPNAKTQNDFRFARCTFSGNWKYAFTLEASILVFRVRDSSENTNAVP